MQVELTVTASIVGALVITLVLAALHLAAPRIRKLPLVPERATGSFAGGLAVAYVFLHLLPEIAQGNEAVGEALSDVIEPTPLFELGIFLVALAGFTVFYGLERLAETSGSSAASGTRSTAGARLADGPGQDVARAHSTVVPDRPRSGRSGPVYWLHLGSFMVYNGLITYTMPLRLRTGIAFALLFAVAMGLHFVLTDRGLEERYPRRFDRRGRFVLAGALVIGWVASALFAPSSTLLVALLTALLGGSVLLNVFKEEIPSGQGSSFLWFLTGLTIYSALLALVTALGG